MIEWNEMPKEPQNVLEEEHYLIFLQKSNRVVSAMHDPKNKWFFYATGDAEHVYPYSYVSFYAEMDWPEYDDSPMISFCEHDNLLVCEECAERHQPTESAKQSEAETLGGKLKELRENRGWTQQQAADKIEVSSQVISNYERDYREPSKDILVRMANVYNTTVDELLGRSPVKTAAEDLTKLFNFDKAIDDYIKKG